MSVSHARVIAIMPDREEMDAIPETAVVPVGVRAFVCDVHKRRKVVVEGLNQRIQGNEVPDGCCGTGSAFRLKTAKLPARLLPPSGVGM